MKVKEDSLNQKEAELENHFQDTTQKTLDKVLLQAKIDSEQQKVADHQTRIKNHAVATQELYEDIHRTLSEKFKLDQK